MRGKTKSKYVGMKFGEWLVNWAEAVRGGHTRFYLTKDTKAARYVMTLRDNELTALSRGVKTVAELIAAKKVLALRGVNAYHNTIHEYGIR